MLVLKRQIGQRIFLSDGVVITLVDVGRSSARIGFEAPQSIVITREEIMPLPSREDAAPVVDS